MRKTTVFAVFFITFLSLLTLTACGNKQAVDNGNRNAFRRPDFGQPEKQADVSGLVKSITGNEVTILKMERSQRGEESDSEAGDAFCGRCVLPLHSGGPRGLSWHPSRFML